MAERPRPRPVFGSEGFWPLINHNYTAAELQQHQEAGAQLAGYRGPMGPSISQWAKEGLVKEIGIPLKKKNTGDPPAEGQDYQGVMVALPLTEDKVKGLDRRVLLVVPREDGCDFAIAGPKQSKGPHLFVAVHENGNNVDAFNRRYWGTETPSIVRSSALNEEAGTSWFNQVIRSQSELDLGSFRQLTEEEDIQKSLNKALSIARRKKIGKEVKSMPANGVEQTLVELGDVDLDSRLRAVYTEFDFNSRLQMPQEQPEN